MMSENPWRDIEPPSVASAVNARRVNASLPWDFFWARGADRSVLLTLSHDAESAPVTPLPNLRDIEVTLSPIGESGTRILALKLLDPAQQDIFLTLCLDIIEGSIQSKSEAEAVSRVLMRTWRWRHLLRGGGNTLLSPEEQKGLVGELFVLERLLLPQVGAAAAVNAWRGPLDAPKDFEVGRVAIEAKAHRGGATPFVAITSEDQLDETGVDALFLYVVDLNEVPEDASDGLTVSEVADRVYEHVFALDPGAAGNLESLFSAAGLRAEDDYSPYRWLEGPSHLYRVTEGFPRIARTELRSGVSHVRYSVSLPDCEPFIATESDLIEMLAHLGGHSAD
ncbi:MAG: PD-(D/E)XK motif protein [Chloroflexota bacterium]|nr:PD-(D/E)XK motif protein [Chloroflexota bacterium]MDE2886564.1 PD-(D/E)XK motif protein [Chloroflexota bacterium]